MMHAATLARAAADPTTVPTEGPSSSLPALLAKLPRRFSAIFDTFSYYNIIYTLNYSVIVCVCV
jgi:hypothetical protein